MSSLALPQYLQSHIANDRLITHTRIPNKTKTIFGGSYHIDDQALGIFFQVYHHYVFGPHPHMEYLTEKQREVGPLAIDLDFRYQQNARAYTQEHVELFIGMVFEELNRLVDGLPDDIEVFVMEKPRVNMVSPELIKDGLHFIFGINMDKTLKEMLRFRLLSRMDQIWEDLKGSLTNNWDSVIDKGVMITTTGWQLYGSRKPDHDAYELTMYYTVSISEGSPVITKHRPPVVTASFLPKLSVRYQEYRTLNNLREIYSEEWHNLRSGTTRPRPHFRVDDRSVDEPIDELTNDEAVDQALARLFDKLGMAKNYVKQAHLFAMALPESYYGAGSHDKWKRVGFALKNTDERLFPSFVKFSSRSSSFSYSLVPGFYQQWLSWEDKEEKGLTQRSLSYWAKNDNRAGYEEVLRGSADSIVNEIIKSQAATEYDLAFLLYTVYRDLFVCTSIKNKTWYSFENHRWVETDSGSNLRKQLSENIFMMFAKKLQEAMAVPTQEKEAAEAQKKRVQKISSIMLDLKNHTKKSNIMKEAADHFYMQHFVQHLDTKPYIIGCVNGIIEFDFTDDKRPTFTFRDGKPDDYVSKSTKIEYEPLTAVNAETVEEIEEFYRQLFPIPSLNAYMWDHCASLLIGKNINQTFNNYSGEGRNGKSVFVDLMSQVLGEYKATVPVTIITSRRVGVGASSSEIAQLMGIRYAVMQEPSKGDKMNEGVMKELTGGDELQARALFKDSVTFPVLFKLAMCSNDLIEIKSNDEGTWRRIRVVPFLSIFCEDPSKFEHKTYRFVVDKNIHQKFKKWRSVLFAMLVERATKTMGAVEDCDVVLEASLNYRNQQDVFSEFLRHNVIKEGTASVAQTDIKDSFLAWWNETRGKKDNPPKISELWAYMLRTNWGTRVLGVQGVPTYWKKIKLIDFTAAPGADAVAE